MKIYKTIYVKPIISRNNVIYMDKKNNHYSLVSNTKLTHKKGWMLLSKIKNNNRFIYIDNDYNKFRFIRSGIFAR